jgi:putative ABC transport system ATP-binding protein
MLSTQSLTFAYNAQNSFAFPDIHATQDKPLLILGQSGCGKTTLLHLIAGLLNPKGGQVLIDGTNIAALPESKRDQFRGQNIGIIFQKDHLINGLSIQENLIAAQYFAGNKQNVAQAKELLERLNLQDKLNAFPQALSQGQRQRVAIARALVNKPKLILADEPTSSLDDQNCEDVIQLLQQQASAFQTTLVIVTHDTRLKERFDKIEL